MIKIPFYVKIDYLMNKNLLKNVTNFQLILGDQSGLNFPLKIILRFIWVVLLKVTVQYKWRIILTEGVGT